MASRRLARRQILREASGLAIGFRLDEPLGAGAPSTQLDTRTDKLTLPAGQDRDTSGETVDSWLVVDQDGSVTIYSGKVELGTGVRTSTRPDRRR